MPVTIGEAYFQRPPFADIRTGELFLSYHCLVCGMRLKTWPAFRAHRAPANCMPLEDEHPDTQPAWALGILSTSDRAALDALTSQLPDPQPIDTAQWAEETLT